MLNNEIGIITNMINSFGINNDSDHRGFCFPNSFTFPLKIAFSIIVKKAIALKNKFYAVNEIGMITNRFNSFGINDDSDHRIFRFPNVFPFPLKNRLFNYYQKSDQSIFTILVIISGEERRLYSLFYLF